MREWWITIQICTHTEATWTWRWFSMGSSLWRAAIGLANIKFVTLGTMRVPPSLIGKKGRTQEGKVQPLNLVVQHFSTNCIYLGAIFLNTETHYFCCVYKNDILTTSWSVNAAASPHFMCSIFGRLIVRDFNQHRKLWDSSPQKPTATRTVWRGRGHLDLNMHLTLQWKFSMAPE